MTLPKSNNSTIKYLSDNEAEEISNSKFNYTTTRMINEIRDV
jgi:hypothetical protein